MIEHTKHIGPSISSVLVGDFITKKLSSSSILKVRPVIVDDDDDSDKSLASVFSKLTSGEVLDWDDSSSPLSCVTISNKKIEDISS